MHEWTREWTAQFIRELIKKWIMRRNNSWVTSWNNQWKNHLIKCWVLIVSYNQGLIWPISVINSTINSWMNWWFFEFVDSSANSRINQSLDLEINQWVQDLLDRWQKKCSKNRNLWIWNLWINWFLNESSQVAIEEVLRLNGDSWSVSHELVEWSMSESWEGRKREWRMLTGCEESGGGE
jgi:hypothetical protein